MSKGACGSCIARVPHPSGDWCRGRARQQCPSVCDWQTRRRRARGALSQHFAAASDTSTVLVHLLRVYRVCVVRRSATEEAVAENFAEPPKDEQVYRCVSQCPCLPSAPTGRTLHAFERYILTFLVLASDP